MRGRGGRAVLASAWAAVAILAVGGCIFEPRTPEPPTGEEIKYLPRTEPGNIIANIEIAFNNRDVAGYGDLVSGGFVYQPDDQTRAEYPGVAWDAWGQEQEMAFAQGLFGRVQQIQMSLPDSVIFNEPGASPLRWDLIYLVKVFENGSETRYRGRAIFELVLEGAFWYVARWEDLSGEPDPDGGGILPTMGALRGAIAGQTR